MPSSRSSRDAGPVRIFPLRTPAHFASCVDIQREVWRHPDLDITPVHQFCASSLTGAIILGAFAGGRLVGYVYSFPADFGRKLVQHSHHLAVLPEFQGGGLGKRLKWAQRAEALRRGYDRITWTYDPLQARNANLNLHALGAVGRTYLKDFYGATPALVAEPGVPTDRLFVEWDIRSRRVEARASGPPPGLDPDKADRAVERRPGGGEQGDAPVRPRLDLKASPLLVELPRSLRELRGRGGLIAAWQTAVRTALVHYFAAGYRLDDFIFGERCFYVLRKERKRP